jgi:hypothetical protein
MHPMTNFCRKRVFCGDMIIRAARCGFLLAAGVAAFTSQLQGGQPPQPESQRFHWSNHRTSVADLVVGRRLQFDHGAVDLTPEEHNAYADLLRSIQERRFAATAEGAAAADTRNAWESSFYRFEDARRRAFSNGRLQQHRTVDGKLTDPFSANGQSDRSDSDRTKSFSDQQAQRYKLVQDMIQHPEDFVGRPVAIYGLFSPSGSVELEPVGRFDWEPRQLQFQRGVLKNLSGSETLAIVDTSGYIDHSSQNRVRMIATGGQAAPVPVLVKGWFVKLWGKRPLIYTESIRVLEPEPYSDWVREFAVPRAKITEPEKWLYYETLRQMDLTSQRVQRQLAEQLRINRIVALKDEIISRQQVESQILRGRRDAAELDSSEYKRQLTRLSRQIALRQKRFQRFLENPDDFPVFVDVFQHPEEWQGQLVTMSGHVRHCVSYTGDEKLLPGQLHELWLFTDDSQHNPAVIVTTDLPSGFPRDADVIDRVRVTGCFFKMYVYSGQEDRRLAPLILAGGVEWNPTDDQVLALAAAGHLPASDSRVRLAASRGESSVSDAAVLLCGFGAIVVMMTVWGRMQRDRRERQRLLDLVDEEPDFNQTARAIRKSQA